MFAIKVDNLAKYLNALMSLFQVLPHDREARVASSSLWLEVLSSLHATTQYHYILRGFTKIPTYDSTSWLCGGNPFGPINKAVNCQSSCKSRKKDNDK